MTNDEWLRDQCNRYRDGDPKCSLNACLRRGGHRSGEPVDYEKATCHAHETLCQLRDLERLLAYKNETANTFMAQVKKLQEKLDEKGKNYED